MKNWMWPLLVAMLTVFVMRTFHIPLWLLLITVIPVLAILLVVGSMLYNLRHSLKFQDLPSFGYVPRIKALDKEATQLEPLGFVKIDQFYFKTIPDSITYAFTHHTEPFYFCLYHVGSKGTYEIFSLFKENFTLTTSCTIDAGLVPRPAKDLQQIFPGGSYETLLNKHREAVVYMVDCGIQVLKIEPHEFREVFFNNFMEHAAYIKKFFLWPIVLLIRVFTKPGKKYCQSIQEQYPTGIPRE